MAFVSDYKHDVFISYAHLDNRRTGWVTTLHEVLEAKLGEILGTAVDIWRDPKLSGNDNFSATIDGSVRNAAVFVAVVTPRYVQSPSCNQEYTTFHSVSRPVGTHSRIMRVRKTPLPAGLAEPPELGPADTLGFPFFQTDAVGSAEFDNRTGFESYASFEAKVFELAAAIARLLYELKTERRRAQPTRPVVFVAPTASALSGLGENLKRELIGRQYPLSPETSLFEDSLLDSAAVEKALQAASFAVHLIGGAYGAVPEGQEHSIPHLLYDRARAAGLRQLVWIAPNAGTGEARARALIENILNDDRCATEIFEGGFEAFKEALFDILAAPARISKPPTAAGKSVYLMVSREDIDSAPLRELRRCLLEQGIPVQLPVFEAEPGTLRQIEEEHVLGNEATLIYYGAAKDAWVDNKRRALINMLSKSAQSGTYCRALYLDAPPNDIKRLSFLDFKDSAINDNKQGLSPLLILGDCQGFSQEKLKRLVSWLRAS